ncbi:MAG: putative iron-regulated protein [Verrucomicrobiales bacterium]|jgi:uncharacterized iron-regulated protein
MARKLHAHRKKRRRFTRAMKTNSIPFLILITALGITLQPASADESLETLKTEAVKGYVAIAGHTTADALNKAMVLKETVYQFAASPSPERHEKAKNAWNIARMPHLQAEVFSIGTEVTKVDHFRQIESILWGEDKSVDGPGDRSSEYFSGGKNTEALEQLQASADAIATELAKTAADWSTGGKDTAAAKFTAQPIAEALATIFGNVSTHAEHLAKVRIGKAYESHDQKDESANYSDLTHAELIYSCSGLANVVAGAYVGSDKEAKVQGSGPLQLATKLDVEQGEKLKLATNRMMLAVTNFRPPFDRALMAPDDSPAREAIKEMMDALEELAGESKASAKALGLVEEAAAKSE